MAEEPQHPGQASPSGPPIFLHPPVSVQASAHGQGQVHVVEMQQGPVRRLVYRSAAAGHVTCEVVGAHVLGSAGVPLRTHAVATARTADEARLHALSKGLARHAAGFWDAETLSKHPPQPPHGIGPGPWVCMWVGEAGQREVWMPAARVYWPYRLSNGRLVGDDEGLACAGSIEAARSGAQAQQVKRRAMLPFWQALARERRESGSVTAPTEGLHDLVVAHAHGLSLAVSFQWSTAGPLHGVFGLGCAADDDAALAQARKDRAHTEAQLRLQSAGVWGGGPQDRPPDMDAHAHRLAWDLDEALAMATLVMRWRARARPAVSAAQHSRLAWADLTSPALRDMGLRVVRALWLDGEGGGLSQPMQPSLQY